MLTKTASKKSLPNTSIDQETHWKRQWKNEDDGIDIHYDFGMNDEDQLYSHGKHEKVYHKKCLWIRKQTNMFIDL